MEGAVGSGSFLGGQGTLATLLLYANFITARPFDIVTRRVMATMRAIRRRGRSMSNAVGSPMKRPIVNTDVLRGNAAGNAVASFSNGFALGITPKTALIVSCVKCGGRRVGIVPKGSLGVVLRRSARALRRIIMINCNIRGGSSIANSIASMKGRHLKGLPIAGMLRTIRNTTTNIAVARASSVPNSTPSTLIHNRGSVGTGSKPCVIISNIPVDGSKNALGSVGPGSVRSVRVLGSTSTATVCNAGNTGNIVLVAAGHNASNGPAVHCGKCFKIRSFSRGLSFYSNTRVARHCESCISRGPKRAVCGSCIGGTCRTRGRTGNVRGS